MAQAQRLSASIVIPAWNAWEHTRACLEALRPTMGPHDKAIVVDNGSTDRTSGGLKTFPWVDVVTNADNAGFAAGCNQGAAASAGEIIVFLNSDTVPVGRWLTELLAPFSDPAVVAAGPRSNFVSGPQLVPTAAYTKKSELRAFERAWREANSKASRPAERLVGFCLAVRRHAFDAIGGFDEGYEIGGYEDDDLCRRLRDAGGCLVIADGSYVHHEGHVSFDANNLDWRAVETANRRRFLGLGPRSESGAPLISACLIVRDEEQTLGTALASIEHLVDEIVVGDTGSTDRTAEVAAGFGAKVLDIGWDEHFAKARNSVAEHCRGRWILWIDADEEWTGDSAAIRRYLSDDPPADAVLVTVSNVMGHGVESRTNHPAVRLFRSDLRWEGRVHEQVVRPDGAGVVAPLLNGATILHHGYEDKIVAGKGKLERNLSLTRTALSEADGPVALGRAELDVGRSLLATGSAREAIGHLEAAADSPEPTTARMGLHVGALAAMSASDLDKSAELIAKLRRRSANPLLADILTAQLAYAARLYAEALALFSRLELPGLDEDRFLHQRSEIAHMVASCHRFLGDAAQSAKVVIDTIRDEGVSHEHLGAVVHDCKVGGVALVEIGRAIPAGQTRAYLAQLLQIDADDSLAVLEGMWGSSPDDTEVLAAVGLVSARANPANAIVWAGRLRQRGLGPCPLLVIASDDERPTLDRVMAAAAAVGAFADEAAGTLLSAILSRLADADIAGAAQIVESLAPGHAASIRKPPAAATVVSAVRNRRRAATIVIPCWNRAPWTLRCLQSIQATLADGTYEVVLVDNGSTDATSNVTDNPSAGVTVVRNDTNRGFAVACNQGASVATSDVVVFCNNDVVAKQGWLQPLLGAIADPRVAMVGSKLLFPDGTIQHAGVGLLYDADGEGWLDGFHLLYRQPADHPAANRPSELRAVTAAVVAVRRSAFEAVGGFDESYWNGNEDVDLCLKLGQAGWSVRYEPASVLVHQESVSGTERFRETTRNRSVLTARWSGKVLDEREHQGVVVAAPFGRGDAADAEGRRLVGVANSAGVPVVTRAWPRRFDGTWAHRLGPGQPLVVSPLTGDDLDAGLMADREWLPDDLVVIAGPEAITKAGLAGPGAPQALLEATGRTRPGTRSAWRAQRAG